jgi:hypothetical protein
MSRWALDGVSNHSFNPALFIANTRDVTSETRTVQMVSQDIERIKRETEYIKNHGERPPNLSFDYQRQLDVV